MGSFEELHKLEMINAKDKADESDKSKGIQIPKYTPDDLPLLNERANLSSNNRNDILNILQDMLPGLEDTVLNDFANEIVSQNISRDKISEFVAQKQTSKPKEQTSNQSTLKLESINTSALNHKVPTDKNHNTPTTDSHNRDDDDAR